ncbi:FAD/NAD(P)-binding domain-containing protein [Nemania abortiva]|nr:FAD/NAD(P)-binding domain-containing protein [Nemania abortiva]
MSASSSSAAKEGSAFTEPQWQALFALLDAVVPSIIEGDTPSVSQHYITVPQHELRDLYKKTLCGPDERFSYDDFCFYMASRPSHDANFVAAVKRSLNRLPPGPSQQLRSILNFMVSRLGSIISTGYWTPFPDQPLAVRASILRSWQQAWFFLWPTLARSFITIGKLSWSQTNQLYLQLNGYKSYNENMAPGPSIDFNFIQFQESVEPTIIETDVVIVGSGCGGGVCAEVLAKAGHRVLVVDQGYYFSPAEFPTALDRTYNIFGFGGGITSADGSTIITSGGCWGGGGTVNWSASLQTPSYVREEWARSGLTFFEGPEYQDSLDRVCNAMGVSDAFVQGNHGNRVLLEGSRRLGWRASVVPQNTGGATHHCGSSCSLGCRSGQKQGPATYWLPAAAKAGARFIEGFEVSQILFAGGKSSKATGLIGKWTSRDEDGSSDSSKPKTQQIVEVKAKTVIISGGALSTPLILLRSGLTNKNIGKNLYLHPVASFGATWDEDVKPWEGEILSSVVTEFENLDGAGHGVKVEASTMQPYASLLLFPWKSGVEFKTAALQYRHMTMHISLCRDRDSGSVTPGPDDGRPVVNYTPSKFDGAHIVTGLVAIAKICYILGAKKLAPGAPDVPYFECMKPADQRGIADEEFVEWLRQLEKTNLDPLRTSFNSAHQMGTARMGVDAETSVVDGDGKVWGCENLYVADASVFPTASGVNPMITIMAIADRIARGIVMRPV